MKHGGPVKGDQYTFSPAACQHIDLKGFCSANILGSGRLINPAVCRDMSPFNEVILNCISFLELT